MNTQDNDHLREEQVLWAVVDENELQAAAREHLRHCRVCSGRVGAMRDDLETFGRRAEQSVPPMTRPVRLPAAVPGRRGGTLGWLPFFGAAAMASLVLFVYSMGGVQTRALPEYAARPSQQYRLQDEPLLDEIIGATDMPLYDSYDDITGEEDPGFDDAFLDFVVPDGGDDTENEFII